MPASHIALLRGINVGGHHAVPMAEPRGLIEQLGHTDVATYVQSGNVVFTSESSDEAAIARGIATALDDRFGFRVAVVVRGREEFARVAARHPHAAAQPDDARLHVVFLADEPGPQALVNLDPARFAPDEFTLEGRHLYAHYPNGAGRSKLTLEAIEGACGTTATARNWRTVTRLLALASAGAPDGPAPRHPR